MSQQTSEVLTRPSWKEQLEGSWVHKLRYLHQWQRKALFTHDRHLQENKHTHTQEHTMGEQQTSQEGAATLPKWGVGECHKGNKLRSQESPCCCCALVVGTVPNSCSTVFPLYIFSAAVHLFCTSGVKRSVNVSSCDHGQNQKTERWCGKV